MEKNILQIKTKPYQTKKKEPKLSHDTFFKLFYSDVKWAKELLKLIFSKKEHKAYNLNKLKIEKDTFETKRADLVFSLPLKEEPKNKVKILILLEHKSHYDKKMFSQLLDYQVLGRKQSIQQLGYPQPIITLLFYHGIEPLKWKKSLQEEDFGPLFSKIPAESRKDMLNYGLRVINTQDPKIRKAYKGRKFKGYSIINLLSEIGSLKKKPSVSKINEVFTEFEEILKDLKGKERRAVELRILEYLRDNTELDTKTWEEVEKLLKDAGVLTQGGLMQDVLEIVKEKGRWEGRQERDKEVVLNMLKKKLDISVISEVTGLSEKTIKKLKNGK